MPPRTPRTPRTPKSPGPLRPIHEPRRETCPWCGSKCLRTRLRAPDLRGGRPGTFTVDECRDCAHVFQNPRLTAEGLVKYVDSLSSVNQREVLVVHDQRTLGEMREAISSARQLLDISARAARDELDRAYQAAQRLRGRHPHTDDLIIGLEKFSPSSSNPGDSLKYLEQLELILSASP